MKVQNYLYYDVIQNPELLKNKKEIAKGFSQIFLDTLFKEVEKEFVKNTPFGNSFGSQLYFDLFFKQISMEIAENDDFPLNKFFEENLKLKG